MKFSTVVLALSAVVAMVQAAPVTVPGDIPLGVHGPEALDIQINLPIEIGDDSSPHKRDLSSFGMDPNENKLPDPIQRRDLSALPNLLEDTLAAPSA
ncbi:hypothetical protein B0O80DRAFT_446156 [Mortierella sp. GBAus27b]|nr:hypothetical protein B0O80DRAFT_446156 [Mortierella sp. GBAus27b]